MCVCACTCIDSYICLLCINLWTHTHILNAESISVYIFPRSLLPTSLSAPGASPVVYVVMHKWGYLATFQLVNPRKVSSHLKKWVSDENKSADFMGESQKNAFLFFSPNPFFCNPALSWVYFNTLNQGSENFFGKELNSNILDFVGREFCLGCNYNYSTLHCNANITIICINKWAWPCFNKTLFIK